MENREMRTKDEILEAIGKEENKILDLVQNLIERCLLFYMSQKEVLDVLPDRANMEPCFTEFGRALDLKSLVANVWQKLEQENQEFFSAYYLRLGVKDQITKFNCLLEKQVELMHQICPAGAASVPMFSGSHIPPVYQNSACYPPNHSGLYMRADNMHQAIGSTLQNAFPNDGSSLQWCMQNAVDVSAHAGIIDVSANLLLAQSSNVGMIDKTNGGMIKSEGGYASSSFIYGSGSSVLEGRGGIGDASLSAVGFVESNLQPLNEPLPNADDLAFAFPGQIPQVFNFPDFPAGFSNSSDMLESYSRSSFWEADTNSFLDPHGKGEHQGLMQNASQKFL